MPTEKRTINFIMRLTPTENAMLRALAETSGLSAADVVRLGIRREYAEKIGSKAPKAKRPAR